MFPNKLFIFFDLFQMIFEYHIVTFFLYITPTQLQLFVESNWFVQSNQINFLMSLDTPDYFNLQVIWEYLFILDEQVLPHNLKLLAEELNKLKAEFLEDLKQGNKKYLCFQQTIDISDVISFFHYEKDNIVQKYFSKQH